MEAIRGLARFFAFPLAVAVAWASLGAGPAQAGLVGTGEVVEEAAAAEDRARVKAFLARDDVQEQLVELGIDPSEARSRVESLTDAEVRRIAGRLEQAPAGGDAVGALIGAAVFIFIVLLITDLIGATDVFPFVNEVDED